jgi:hypothetical protein
VFCCRSFFTLIIIGVESKTSENSELQTPTALPVSQALAISNLEKVKASISALFGGLASRAR